MYTKSWKDASLCPRHTGIRHMYVLSENAQSPCDNKYTGARTELGPVWKYECGSV